MQRVAAQEVSDECEKANHPWDHHDNRGDCRDLVVVGSPTADV